MGRATDKDYDLSRNTSNGLVMAYDARLLRSDV